ncbi:hypothetical protein HYH03_013829 [Edaphochlamys debaryana]|uniref:Uncharacterized protein n=1 Tax=Edaphochlamys debaryana TaxID=47281 RepID=A0A835XVD5_9CHLO|nr:hypothetical protein HYH03_013829 [Edaphochlamys debaryana]|eukprot:KAG2487550.1 hypothetical protein HYH03_013829 [Edaphochlamys debaryana]
MGGCFCIPPPASQQARKVYNILVPDVFPLNAPKPQENLSKGVERKIEKLAEYLQKQPARAGKVSRRLTRRIKKELTNRQYGYVKVAVRAYRVLLAKSLEEESPFTYGFFAKELIEEPDTVILTLLAHPDPFVQALGADLLASYIQAQSAVDHQMRSVEPLVTRASGLAQKGGSEQGASAQATTLACLRAVDSFVGLCQELKTLPPNLEEIEKAVLLNLDTSPAAVTRAASGGGAAAMGPDGALAGAAGGPAPDTSTVPGLAHSVLLRFQPFLQDIGTVYRVMETMFTILDEKGRWQQTDYVQRLMAIVQSSCSDQPFPLFTALMRHCSAPGLGPDERAVVAGLALQQPSVYSLSAFSMALQELPRALTADANASTTKLRTAVMAAVRKLALEVGDAGQMCEAISSVLRQHATPTKTAQACLECSLVACEAIPSFPEPGRTFPGGHAPAQLLQQLAAIIGVWGPAEADSRATAVALLGAVLPACGPGLRDEKQALGLMDLVLQMARNVALGAPADVATMSRVLSACLASRQPELLLHGVRLSRALAEEALKLAPAEGAAAAVERAAAGGERPGSGDDQADYQWGAALLLLLNNLLSGLAATANCQGLAQLRFTVPPEACSSLKEEGGLLVAVSPVFEGGAAAAAAEACLRGAAKQWSIEHWYGKALDALCKGSLLETHFSHSLQNLVFEPFAAHPLPGLPSTQQLAVQGQAGAGAGAAPSASASSALAGAPSGGMVQSSSNAALITSKLEAMARNRVASIRRERLNLQHVMDMLGDGEADESTAPGAQGAAAHSNGNGAVSPRDVALTVAEAVAALDAVAGLDKAPPPAAAGGPGPLEMAELVQRVEAVTG